MQFISLLRYYDTYTMPSPMMKSTVINLDTGSRHTIWCSDEDSNATHTQFLQSSRGAPMKHVIGETKVVTEKTEE